MWGLNGLSRSKPAILRCVVLLDHSWEKATMVVLARRRLFAAQASKKERKKEFLRVFCSTKHEFLRLFAAQARKNS
jgi:hypothetical protein